MVLLLNQSVDAPDIFGTKHNLLDTGNRPGSDGRWEEGVVFVPQGCFDVNVEEANCPPAEKSADFQDCPDAVSFVPFVIEFGVQFIGHEITEAVERELDIKTSAAIEEAIWGGTATSPTNPKLSDGVATGGTAANSREAMARLEAKLIADGMQGGTIHMSAYDAVLAEGAMTEKDGKLYSSVTGNPVVVGNYPAGQMAIHGGEIDVYVSEEFTTSSYEELLSNTLLYKVERLALAVWNPCYVFTQSVT
jgi:hypothetical protein